MENAQIAAWAPWLGFAGSVVGAIAALWVFALGQRMSNRKPFLEKQLELCFEITEAVAALAVERDNAAYETARRTFWRLYYGRLHIVEDRDMESAMVALGDIVPKASIDAANSPSSELKAGSLRLARAARALILKSWRVNLPQLADHRA